MFSRVSCLAFLSSHFSTHLMWPHLLARLHKQPLKIVSTSESLAQPSQPKPKHLTPFRTSLFGCVPQALQINLPKQSFLPLRKLFSILNLSEWYYQAPRNLGDILDFSSFISQIQTVMKSYQFHILNEHFPRWEHGVVEDKKGVRIEKTSLTREKFCWGILENMVVLLSGRIPRDVT